MTRARLEELLGAEVKKWSGRPYFALRDATYPVVTRYGSPGSSEVYEAEVAIVELTSEYVHLTVAVDDGGLTAFLPVSTSLLVYADGRVDVP